MTKRCQCGRPAKYYAIDPAPGGWGDYACGICVNPQWIKEPYPAVPVKEESCQHGMAMWLCATPGGSRTDPHYPTHL